MGGGNQNSGGVVARANPVEDTLEWMLAPQVTPEQTDQWFKSSAGGSYRFTGNGASLETGEKKYLDDPDVLEKIRLRIPELIRPRTPEEEEQHRREQEAPPYDETKAAEILSKAIFNALGMEPPEGAIPVITPFQQDYMDINEDIMRRALKNWKPIQGEELGEIASRMGFT